MDASALAVLSSGGAARAFGGRRRRLGRRHSRVPARIAAGLGLGRPARGRGAVAALAAPFAGVRLAPLGWAAGAMALALARRRLGLPRAVSMAVTATVPAAVAAALPRGRGRAAALWASHMWAYKVAFEIPFDAPEALRRRLRVMYPLRADRWLGAGRPPTERLQCALRRPLEVTALDRLLAAVYVLWEAEPHLALAWILLRHRDRFPAAALRLAATYDLSLVAFWLVPTAPPWWASQEQGLMGGRVKRVPTRVVRDLRGEPLEQDDVQGSNPWASMPSNHFATAATTAMLVAEIDRRAGVAAWAYALALGFALVYHGEHYVVDLLAGLGLAAAVRAIGRGRLG
jgi:PAP2 superfamily